MSDFLERLFNSLRPVDNPEQGGGEETISHNVASGGKMALEATPDGRLLAMHGATKAMVRAALLAAFEQVLDGVLDGGGEGVMPVVSGGGMGDPMFGSVYLAMGLGDIHSNIRQALDGIVAEQARLTGGEVRSHSRTGFTAVGPFLDTEPEGEDEEDEEEN